MEDPDLRDYLATLHRRRWVVIATMGVLAAGALAFSMLRADRYRAEAELLLERTPGEQLLVDGNGQVRSARDAERRINNEVRLIESEPIRAAVAEAYDGPLDVEDVTATAQAEEADIIELQATATDPAAVADLVNVYTDTYLAERRQQEVDDLLATASDIQEQIDGIDEEIDEERARLDDLDRRIAEAADADTADELRERRTEVEGEVEARVQSLENRRQLDRQQLNQVEASAELTRSGGVQLVAPAEEPRTPTSPGPVRDVPVALLVGLVVGVGLAFAVDRLDDSVRSKHDTEKLTGLPTLGLIPVAATRKAGRHGELVSLTDPASPTAEAHRALRTSLKFLAVDSPVRTVLVTSTAASEGKTMTAANLAVALAQAGERVLLLDADLRRPRLHDLFGAPASPGLTTLLLEDRPLDSVVLTVAELPNLHVVPPGLTPPNPAELLDSDRAAELLRSLAETYDTVVVDSPPVLPVTDAQVLSRHADALLFVVACDQTSRRGLGRALELLGQVDAPVVGTVINRAPSRQTYAGRAYRYEAYGSRDGVRRPRSRPEVASARAPATGAGGDRAGHGTGPGGNGDAAGAGAGGGIGGDAAGAGAGTPALEGPAHLEASGGATSTLVGTDDASDDTR